MHISLIFLQLYLVLVGGLRTASDLVLGCGSPAYGVGRAVDLQVVSVLQDLSFVAQLLAVLVLAVTNDDHPLVSGVRLVSMDV